MTLLETQFMQIVRQLSLHRSARDVLTVFCRVVADRIDPGFAGSTECQERERKLTGDYSIKEKAVFERCGNQIKLETYCSPKPINQ